MALAGAPPLELSEYGGFDVGFVEAPGGADEVVGRGVTRQKVHHEPGLIDGHSFANSRQVESPRVG